MLKLGDKSISKLYLGDKAISKAYLGEKLVFQAGRLLFLDYIITDGNSYIDTEYCPNENTYIEYTFEIIKTPPNPWNGLFGSRQSTDTYVYNTFCRNNMDLRLDFGVYDDTNYSTQLNTKYTIKAGLGEVYVNDELVKTYTPKIAQSPYSMYLGNFNQAGNPYTTGIAQNIYGFKVYEKSVQLHDFKPCIAPNGQVAMYDAVTKKYFYNQGTGELKAGGRFVQSILFDGASIIDTGIAHQTCTIETTIRFDETGTRQLMGFGSGSGQYWGKAANQTTFEYFGGTNAMDKTDVVLEFMCDDATAPYIIMYADGKSRVGSTGANISEIPYIIGGLKVTLTSTTIYYPFTGEVWSNKTTIDGEVVQDLRPYVDSDGVACFKDVVTGNLFYNAGTGTLGYTE